MKSFWKYLLAKHSLVLVITLFFGILLTYVGDIRLAKKERYLKKHYENAQNSIADQLIAGKISKLEADDAMKKYFQQLFQDPDFQGLPTEKKREFLAKVDQDFAGLPPTEQNKGILELSVGRPFPFDEYLVLLAKFFKFGGGYLLYLFLGYLLWAVRTVRSKPKSKTVNTSISEINESLRKKRTLMEKDENKGIWRFGDTIPRGIKLWVKDWWILLAFIVGVITFVKYVFDIISFFSK